MGRGEISAFVYCDFSLAFGVRLHLRSRLLQKLQAASRALAPAFPLREQRRVGAQPDVERALLEHIETAIRRGGRRAPISQEAREEGAVVGRRQIEFLEIVGRPRLVALANQVAMSSDGLGFEKTRLELRGALDGTDRLIPGRDRQKNRSLRGRRAPLWGGRHRGRKAWEGRDESRALRRSARAGANRKRASPIWVSTHGEGSGLRLQEKSPGNLVSHSAAAGSAHELSKRRLIDFRLSEGRRSQSRKEMAPHIP